MVQTIHCEAVYNWEDLVLKASRAYVWIARCWCPVFFAAGWRLPFLFWVPTQAVVVAAKMIYGKEILKWVITISVASVVRTALETSFGALWVISKFLLLQRDLWDDWVLLSSTQNSLGASARNWINTLANCNHDLQNKIWNWIVWRLRIWRKI